MAAYSHDMVNKSDIEWLKGLFKKCDFDNVPTIVSIKLNLL